MENEQPSSLFGLSVDDQARATLKAASQWGRVLAVLGFILGGLVLLLGIVVYGRLTGSYGGNGNAYRSSVQAAATRNLIFCILTAGIFITSGIFTLNFSNRTSTALNTSDQYSLNSGLAAIRGGIIFWAVIFIIFILLLLLAFIGLAYV
ncbi:MAG TPA: hypothetical protein VIZ28_15900 [Chitinophagaceae bacterium]